MTRFQFNSHFAATPDTWHEPETLDRLNDAAYAWMRFANVDDANIEQITKAAFDYANNSL